MRRILLALVVAAALASSAHAVRAGTTGGLTGTVTNLDGAPIAGAVVRAYSDGDVATTKTDAHGFYCFASLAPAHYDVSFKASGYNETLVRTTIFADEVARAPISLLKAIIVSWHFDGFSYVRPGDVSSDYGYFAAAQYPAPPVGFDEWLLRMTPGIVVVPGAPVMH